MAVKGKVKNDLSGVSFNITAQPGKQQMAMDLMPTVMIYGGAAGCVDADTEYLSPDGWNKISKWDGSDVAQVDPKTRKVSFCYPSYVEEEEHKDIFYSIKNVAGIDQVLTMTHRFVFYKKRKSKKHFQITVGDLIALQQSPHPLRGYVETLNGERIPFNKARKQNTYLKITQTFPEDNTKYCFETETGYLLLRRNGHTFLTGNSGKSRLLLLKALKFVHKDPDFGGVLFRRTTKAHKSAGGLFVEAKKLYAPLRPHVREQAMEMEFNATKGGTLKFDHLEHESTAEANHQGTQYSMVGMDECAHFTQTQMLYMLGRLRSASQTDSFFLGTCNPDADSWLLKWVLPYLKEDGMPDEDKVGKIMYFVIHNDEPVFAETAQELKDLYPEACQDVNANTGEIVNIEPQTFCLISGTIYDNPELIRLNPRYLANLKAQTKVNRDRLLHGSWSAREQGSSYFERDWLNKIAYKDIPNTMKYVRAWDKASSIPTEKYRYPDYTTSIKMGKDLNGNIYIFGDFDMDAHDDGTNVIGRFRRLPGDRDNLIETQAHIDGDDVVIVLPKDPSGAGVVEFQESAKKLIAKGFIVKPDAMPGNKKKLQRFFPFSSACQNGFVYIVEESFPNKETLEHFYKELEVFNGERSTATIKDDIPDCVASAFNTIQQEIVYDAVSIPTPSAFGSRTLYAKSGLKSRVYRR